MKQELYKLLMWLGILIAAIVAAISAILGWIDDLPMQNILLYAVAIFGIIVWVWHHFLMEWSNRHDPYKTTDVTDNIADTHAAEIEQDTKNIGSARYIHSIISEYKGFFIGTGILLGLFAAIAIAADNFFTFRNILASIVILAIYLFIYIISSISRISNKNIVIGISLVIGLYIVSSLVVEGFSSWLNIKSMLVFAAFLGLACIGQTLVALLGGLDLSIPFVIGAANVGLIYILELGVPSWLALPIIILLGALVGCINGFLSFRLQGQALILTLGTGFIVTGGAQILTGIGTDFAGSVFGDVPKWLVNIAAVNGVFFGIQMAPIIFIWIILSIIIVYVMRHTAWGRSIYALGGHRNSARSLLISERGYWVGAYTISGLFAAVTGAMLLGWSGGGFIDVGEPYLFLTIAAVVVGGTSLLGGIGGYGLTVIGVLVLQLLSSFLVGIGFTTETQQLIIGLLILPMVAMYARMPHIRTQI